MDNRDKIIAVLDIGSSKIVCLIARIDKNNHLAIIGTGHQPSEGVGVNGVISDIKALEDRIVAAVSEAESSAGEEISSVLVNITGNKLHSNIKDVEVSINGADINRSDVKRIISNAFVEFSSQKNIVIQALPVSYSLDGIKGIKNPCYMCGDKLTAHLNVITIDQTAKKNLNQCLVRCHLAIDAIIPSAYASSLACLSVDEMKTGVTLIDIGDNNSSIAIFDDGNLAYTTSLPLGGRLITNDIKQLFTLKNTAAERVKTIYGSVFMDNESKRDIIDLSKIINDNDPTDGAYIQKHKLSEVVADRSEEMLKFIKKFLETDKSSSKFYNKAGLVVITGGTSNLVGFADLASNILGRKVRVGKVDQIDDIEGDRKDPIFATTYGLLKLAIENRHKESLGFFNADEQQNPIIKLFKKITFYDKISTFVKKYF